MKINEIYLGDCLELMHQIPDQSIDMVLADLPYGTTACAWDSIIPLEPLWEHYKRVIKPRGAIVLTASQPFTTMLAYSNLGELKCEWIWEKDVHSNFAIAGYHPLKYHESILVFGKESTVYNPQMRKTNKPSNIGGSGKYKRDGLSNSTVWENIHIPSNIKYPKSIIKFNTTKHNDGVNGSLHPTQKPVALFAYLIRTYTNPGDLVLDNAAGSGTTAIAAIETGRNWLLIEKDPEYYQVAKDRITERLKQPFLPGLGGTAHNKQFTRIATLPRQSSCL